METMQPEVSVTLVEKAPHTSCQVLFEYV